MAYNSNETIPIGATVTEANSGGEGNDAYGTVLFPAGGDIVGVGPEELVMNGERCVKTFTDATAGACVFGWQATVGELGDGEWLRGQVYMNQSHTPVDNNVVIRFSREVTIANVSIFLMSSGVLRASASGVAESMTSVVPINANVRIQFYILFHQSAGEIVLRYFDEAATSSGTETPTETLTMSSLRTLGDASAAGTRPGEHYNNTYRFGNSSSRVNWGPFYWDSPEILANSAEWPTVPNEGGAASIDPENLQVSVVGSTASLTWDASVSGVDEYKVFRRSPQTGAPFDPEVDTPIATVTAPTTSYNDEGLADGNYDWQVFGATQQ